MGRPPGSRPLWARILARIGVGLGILLGMLLLIPLAALTKTLQLGRLPQGKALIRQVALDQTRAILPGLRVGRIQGDITERLVLKDVELRDRFGGRAIAAAEVELRYDLWSLLHQRIRVKKLRLVAPRVWLQNARSGRLNMSELLRPTPPEPEPEPSSPFTWRVDVENLELELAGMEMDEEQGAPLKVANLTLNLKGQLQGQSIFIDLQSLSALVTLPNGERVNASLQGKAGLSGDRLKAKIKLGASTEVPPWRAHLDLAATGTLDHPIVDLKLSLEGGGSLALKGQAQLSGGALGPYDFKIALDHVNPQVALPQLPRADINLDLEARGKGLPPNPGSEAMLTLQSKGAKVMHYSLQSLIAKARMRGDHWTLDQLKLQAEGSRIDLKGEGDLAQVSSSEVKLSIPRLGRLPLPSTVPRLGGSVELSARVKGPFVGPYAGSARLSGRQLAVDRIRLGQLAFSGNVQGLPLRPRGMVKLSGEGLLTGIEDLKVDRFQVQADGGLQGLTVSLDAKGPKLVAQLSSRVTPAKSQVDVLLQRLLLAFKGYRLRALEPAQIRYRFGQDLDLKRLRVAFLGGEVKASGVFRQRGFPRLEARVQAKKIQPLPLRPRISLDLQARLGRRRLEATLKASGASEMTLLARVPVQYRGGSPLPGLAMAAPLLLDLRAPDLALQQINHWVDELEPLSGEVDLALKAGGTLRAPTAGLDLDLQGVAFGPRGPLSGKIHLAMGTTESQLKTDLRLGERPLLSANTSVELTLGGLLRPKKVGLLLKAPLKGALRIHPSSLDTLHQVVMASRRHLSGKVSARMELGGSLGRPAVKLSLSGDKVQVDQYRLPRVKSDLRISGGDQQVKMNLNLEAAGRPLLRAQGKLGRSVAALVRGAPLSEAPLEVTASIPQTPLRSLLSQSPSLARIRGTLSSEVSGRGSLGKPTALIKVDLNRAGLGRGVLGDLLLKGKLKDRLLTSSVDIKQPGAGRLSARVNLDSKKPDGLDLSLKGKKLDLAFFRHLSPAVRELEGTLDLDLSARGRPASPRLKGTVQLNKGRAVLRGMGPLKDLALGLTIDPQSVKLTKLHASSGDGELDATGSMDLKDLRPTRFQFKAKADDFDLAAEALKDSTFSGEITAAGGLSGSTFSTDVVLNKAVVKLAKLQGQKKLHSSAQLPEVVFVDGPGRGKARKGASAGARKPPAGMSLNVSLKAKPFYVRSEETDIEASTSLQAKTNEKGQVRIFGEVRIRRGWVLVMDNKYTIERAVAQLSGEAKPDPVLDVLLSRRFPDATIYIALGGTASDPKLKLRSDPDIYDDSQCLAMVLTGKPAVVNMDSDGGDPSMAVVSAVSQAVIGQITRTLAPKVGLDVARVSLAEQKDKNAKDGAGIGIKAQAEVGKYITERLYLGYRKVFGADEEENSHEAVLEFTISAQWLITAVFGDRSVGGLDIFWAHRW